MLLSSKNKTFLFSIIDINNFICYYRLSVVNGGISMAIGERMRAFRNAIGMTQKELGKKLGFSEHTAVIRVGQYENEKRTPKPDMINQLAQIFDVAPEAIAVPNIDNYYGLMHTLFTLEDRYGLTVANIDGEVCLKQNINHPDYDMTLADYLRDWNEMKTKLNNGSIRTAEYDHWRHSFPEDLSKKTRDRIDQKREHNK